EGWSEATETTFTGKAEQEAWLRYRHVINEGGENRAPGSTTPQLIMDFMGYNTGKGGMHASGVNWASDLIVECDVDVKRASGKFALEVSKGTDRFRATFDLASGECTLSRLSGTRDDKVKVTELKKVLTGLKGTGRHHVRFANVDDRLLVWVDGNLPFTSTEGGVKREGVEYEADRELVPTRENDLERP